MAEIDRKAQRIKRQKRLRKRIAGTAEKPRLAVYRSLHHIHAQIIDDSKGHTLVAASTLEDEVSKDLKSTKDRQAARTVGEVIARRALEQGIRRVVFDRGGNAYHGRVAALAEGARSEGLEF